MPITHEHARRLIQFRLDGGLQSAEKEILSAHLQDCRECQAYATEINEVETVLRPLLKRQWSAQPTPLSIASLRGNNQNVQLSTFLTMRRAAVSLMILAVFFSVWQFTSPSPSAPIAMPLVIPSVPTPSAQTAQSTSTGITSETCQMTLYTVQADDTLASIADRFLVSEELLMDINRLSADAIHQSMELAIPICHLTPTGTIHPATLTTTYTPILHPKTSTPGG